MTDTQRNLGAIITIFVLGLIGIILIQPIADQVDEIVNTQSTVNETVTYLNGTNTSLAHGNISSVTVINSSGITLNIGNFTIFAVQGILQWEFDNNDSRHLESTLWNASYNFEGDDFISDSATRTIVDLVVIFFALAVFGFVIFGAMKIFKEFTDL